MHELWEQSVRRQVEVLRREHGEWLPLEDVAGVCGLRLPVLRRLVELDLVRVRCEDTHWLVPVEDLVPISQMTRLHGDLGVSWSSMGLVLELLDRIRSLEAELRDRG